MVLTERAMLFDRSATVTLSGLATESWLDGRLESLRGRAVLVNVRDQLSAALTLVALNGVAQRLVLCPPGVPPHQLSAVVRVSRVDACVIDEGSAAPADVTSRVLIPSVLPGSLQAGAPHSSCNTDWILLTSASTGAPKLVQHSIASLTSALGRELRAADRFSAEPVIWGTFYDIRRYGGLQILLRGLRAGAMILSDHDESIPAFMARAGDAGVTHISGTASHWRAALMSGAAARIAPRYIRLSGEIADQGILDALHDTYPRARIAHAFATTEAGVAFEVEDGLAGFPQSLIGDSGSVVEMKIADGTLRVRSPGCAERYLGEGAPALRDPEGFVDTGDRVELRGGRYYFMGRSGGVINVGGLKVHPEEVEAIINAHPGVRMSRVTGRRSPITGAVVTAEAVPVDIAASDPARAQALAQDILEHCRRSLPGYKVPATVRVVTSLPLSPAGKLLRPDA